MSWFIYFIDSLSLNDPVGTRTHDLPCERRTRKPLSQPDVAKHDKIWIHALKEYYAGHGSINTIGFRCACSFCNSGRFVKTGDPQNEHGSSSILILLDQTISVTVVSIRVYLGLWLPGELIKNQGRMCPWWSPWCFTSILSASHSKITF